MKYEDFLTTWFNRIGFRVFSFNLRGNNIPNLWCLCTTNLNPMVLDVNDQQVSFSIETNGVNFCFSTIYASTSNLKRKHLWNRLTFNQSQYIAPWCFIGDFNTIFAAHEHQGFSIMLDLPS